MSGPGTTPLVVDTGALFAHFVENSPRHDRSRNVMEAIQDGTLRFRPLYTTGYVLSELATLLLRKANHEVAMDAISRVQESPAVTVLHPGKTQFRQTCEQFERFDDQQISFVDHMTGVIAADYDAEYIFTFDSDFRTLGYSLVPADVDVDPEG